MPILEASKHFSVIFQVRSDLKFLKFHREKITVQVEEMYPISNIVKQLHWIKNLQ